MRAGWRRSRMSIRAQVELTTMRGELLMLESEREGLQATLNGLLARRSSAPLAAARAAASASRRRRSWNRMRWWTACAATTRSCSPSDARIRAAEKSRELTYRNRYPDFAVGVSPIQMGSRIGEWEMMLEVNIPLQQETRRRAGIARPSRCFRRRARRRKRRPTG